MPAKATTYKNNDPTPKMNHGLVFDPQTGAGWLAVHIAPDVDTRLPPGATPYNQAAAQAALDAHLKGLGFDPLP